MCLCVSAQKREKNDRNFPSIFFSKSPPATQRIDCFFNVKSYRNKVTGGGGGGGGKLRCV
jgi:hypothetical protein